MGRYGARTEATAIDGPADLPRAAQYAEPSRAPQAQASPVLMLAGASQMAVQVDPGSAGGRGPPQALGRTGASWGPRKGAVLCYRVEHSNTY